MHLYFMHAFGYHYNNLKLLIISVTSRSGATRRNGSTDVCSKVMHVISIYLLNVVVKQESLTKT